MKNIIGRIKTSIQNARTWIEKRFFKNYPGKKTVNLAGISAVGLPVTIGLAFAWTYFSSPNDSSRLVKSTESVRERLAKTAEGKVALPPVKGISNEVPAREEREKPKVAARTRPSNINYRAKQVIERADYSDPSTTLPRGTAFIGRLLTSIDTRSHSSLTKIELPYGGSFQGNEILPRGSVLFATANYDGNGEKVFLDVQSGIYPDGEQFQVRAQVLTAKDYSPGIEGDYHGTFTNRVASNLGLTFVSGLTDVLQDKESLGGGGAFQASPITPKPTLKNGLLAGVSKVTDSEAQRMAQELAGQKPFVTVESGKELIVSLLERFVKGNNFEPGQKGK